jgi:hypothetical protein
MKTTTRGILAAGVLLLASATHSFSIEGLKLSVQCPDVILGWPSTAGENFIIQWRPSLDPSTDWATLTNSLPANGNTNWTTFVHSNQIQCAAGGSANDTAGGSLATPLARRTATATIPTAPTVTLAMPADGSGSAVPLALYPPGYDLSRLIIFDPSVGAWVCGSGYQTSPAHLNLSHSDSIQHLDDPQPLDDNSNSPPAPGFYRVVRNDVHFWGITNGMVLSGLVTIPIEYSVTSTDTIVGMTFYGNGSPLIGASQTGNAIQWDTTAMPNGSYAINAELDFCSDPSVAGTPVTVTVNNVISFPNYFTHVFGGQMWIYAQTIPYANYQIDMYDENTNYFGSFVDYADGNGVISFLWDLTDGNGYTFDSTNFTGVFTVDTSSLFSMNQGAAVATSPGTITESLSTGSPGFKALSPAQPLRGTVGANGPTPNGGSSTASVKDWWVKEPSWSVGNSWAVACSPQATGPYPYFTEQMMLGGPGGEYGGVNFRLSDSGCPLSPGNNAYDYVSEINNKSDKTNFLSYLADPNFRHCYFFGDGNATSFGSRLYKVPITLGDLRTTLGNKTLTTTNGAPLYAMSHPYRLVFIDACSSARGNLCEGFGIPAFELNTNYFRNSKFQSRAFVGYTKDIISNLGGNNWINRSQMLGWFFADWLSGLPITNCVYNAKNDVYKTQATMDSSAVVYGAYDLQINTDTTP